MTTTMTVGGGFDIGRVVQRTFNALAGNLPTFVVLALLLVGLPAALVSIGQAQLGAETTLFGQGVSTLYVGTLLVFVAGLINLIASFVLQAAVIYGAVAYLNGQTASVGECLSTGLRHWWRLLVLAILMGLGIFTGFIFFFVPGVILAVRWVVAVPVQVIENRSATGSMGRSADLTHGRRWTIFALLLVYTIAVSVIEGAVVATATGLFAGSAAVGRITLVTLLVRPLLTTATSLIGAAGAASIYYELRSTREGIGPEALAAVFD